MRMKFVLGGGFLGIVNAAVLAGWATRAPPVLSHRTALSLAARETGSRRDVAHVHTVRDVAPRLVIAPPSPVVDKVPLPPVGPVLRVEEDKDTCPHRHFPETHEALDRCIAGDGEGCVGVGDSYERGECDGFSSIKWYRRGCRLGSPAACDALVRLGDSSRGLSIAPKARGNSIAPKARGLDAARASSFHR